MKTASIDIKEEDFDIKHKTKSQYNGSYTPKSTILGGWDVGDKKIQEAFHSPRYWRMKHRQNRAKTAQWKVLEGPGGTNRYMWI